LLKNSKVAFRKTDDPAEVAAEYLERGEIVGWFQGRMEFGARALGNRSILANPVFPGMKDKVNGEVKYRESWRPFCPSLIEEALESYIVNPNEASYMTIAYHASQSLEGPCPSVVHVDDNPPSIGKVAY